MSALEVAPAHAPPFAPGHEVAVVHEFYGYHAERIRALRTELLLYAGTEAGGCAIAIVSAGRCEGRSRLAADLAAAFAQLHQPTLLVDADLRRPTQHWLFGAQGAVRGLAEALAAASMPEKYPVLGLPELAIVPAGVPPPQPLDLLSDPHFAGLIGSWCREFRFVILDTPPASNYADALAVAHVARRALLVNRAGTSTFRDSRAVLRRLAGTGVDVVGAVLNHF